MEDPTINSPSAANAVETPAPVNVETQPSPPQPAPPQISVLEQAPQKAESGPVEPKQEKPKSPTLRSSAQSRNAMNGPLYMQTSNNRVIVRRVKRKEDGFVRGMTRWLLDNQTGMVFPIFPNGSNYPKVSPVHRNEASL